MTAPINFTSSIDLPDGRRIYVSIDVPEGHPSLAEEGDLLDNTEYAQMGVAHVLRILRSGDHHRARRRDEEITKFNADIVAKLTGEAPF